MSYTNNLSVITYTLATALSSAMSGFHLCVSFPLPSASFFVLKPVRLYPIRLMKEKSVDTVDIGLKKREMPMEREYQRVSISGEEKCGVRISNQMCLKKHLKEHCTNLHFYYLDLIHLQVPFTDLVDAAKCVVKALFIREKYINRSMQMFCKTTAHALQDLGARPLNLRVYDDIPETPVDAGIIHTHPVWSMLFHFSSFIKKLMK